MTPPHRLVPVGLYPLGIGFQYVIVVMHSMHLAVLVMERGVGTSHGFISLTRVDRRINGLKQ